MDTMELYRLARAAVRPLALRGGEAGQVACALETASGAVCTGVCIDLPCGLGFCAEQAAAAEMLRRGETAVRRLAAVSADGAVLPPCGRCREFLAQLDERNLDAEILLAADGRRAPLRQLLPERWDGA